MILVGLTGNIASGKSTVARLLAAHGATIIDADALARRAVEPGSPALRAIVARWGNALLLDDGTLDRAALRRIVFANPAELEALNAMVHPEVRRLRDEDVAAARARDDRLVVCDIPLLYEQDMEREFARVILVHAPEDVRLERLMRDRGLSRDDAMLMIVAQMPAELKRARADLVVENASTLEALEARVNEVWRTLERMA
ncbi:MAG TPA: dephospho-CoA kinase [Gemmatimonadaceae bacterium]|nr:dephospho-CoA kinase [Gemmatimonadaceae bacterium]